MGLAVMVKKFPTGLDKEKWKKPETTEPFK
jgi:hypothetical protein